MTWVPTIEPEQVKAILFDLDGTLADTDDQWIARVSRWIKPLHFAFPQRDPTPFLRWGLMEAETPLNFLYTIPDRIGLDEPLHRLQQRLRKGRPPKPQRIAAVTGVLEMLPLLAARYPLAVISTRDVPKTAAFIDGHNLRPYFKVIVTARSAPRLKPHPAPVLLAARQLHIPIENCLMVGDTTLDIRAGRAAGAQTVGVLCGFGRRWELERYAANLILETTADLLAALN